MEVIMKKIMVILTALTVGAHSLQADQDIELIKQVGKSAVSLGKEFSTILGEFGQALLEAKPINHAVDTVVAPVVEVPVQISTETVTEAVKELKEVAIPAAQEFQKEVTPALTRLGHALSDLTAAVVKKVGNATLSAGKYVGNKVADAGMYAGTKVANGTTYVADKAFTAMCNGTQYVGSCIQEHPKRTLAVAGVLTLLAYAKHQAIQEKNKALAELATAPHDINNRWSREDRERRIQDIQNRYEAVLERKLVNTIQATGILLAGAAVATYNAGANLITGNDNE